MKASIPNWLKSPPQWLRRTLGMVVLTLLAVLSVQQLQAQIPYIGVSFEGRNPNTFLNASDVAGVMPQPNWNNVREEGLGIDGNPHTTQLFLDAADNPTPVTLTYSASDSWNNNDSNPNTNPDHKLMFGIIKSTTGATDTFTFNNLPARSYDLLVYLGMDADNVGADFTAGSTTFYVTETHTFGGTYIQALNTTLPTDEAGTGTRDLGNYIRFTGLTPDGNSQITLTAVHKLNGNGLGIAALQLARTPTGPALARCYTLCESNKIHVLFDQPVKNVGTYSVPGLFFSSQNYGASQSEVILTTDTDMVEGAAYSLTVSGEQGETGNPLDPDPTTCQFSYGSSAPTCTGFADLASLPLGSVLTGSAVLGDDGTGNSVLHLTDAGQAGANGNFFIPDQNAGAPVNLLQVKWKSKIGAGDAGGADGVSFSWAENITSASTAGEDGTGNGLVVDIDTWDNGAPDFTGLEMKWQGAQIATKVVNKNILRPNVFVDSSLLVTPDGYAEWTYDGMTIGGWLPGFDAGLAGANFLFGARTGGANENHWIDDLCINAYAMTSPTVTSGPSDTTVAETQTATFTVTVDGVPPFAYFWLSNNVPIPGATGIARSKPISYTTPVTDASYDGVQYSVGISNECGITMSPVATLTVNPAPILLGCNSHAKFDELHLLFDIPVHLDGVYSFDNGCDFCYVGQRYGSNHAEVIVDLDTTALGSATTYTVTALDVTSEETGALIFPDPSTCTFTTWIFQDETAAAAAGRFAGDYGNNALPGGSLLHGNNGFAYVDDSGIVHLTDTSGGSSGSLGIPDSLGGVNQDRLTAHWKQRFGNPSGGGADGFSFNWGPNLPNPVPFAGPGGVGNGLSVTIDTYNNIGTPGEVGLGIKYGGSQIAFTISGGGQTADNAYFMKGTFVDASVSVNKAGHVTVNYDTIKAEGDIPGWAGLTVPAGNLAYVFVAATGGAASEQWVKDIVINGVSDGPPIIAVDPADLSRVEGLKATLAVSADGYLPLSYQWYSNNVALPSSNDSSFTTDPTTIAAYNNTKWKVVVSNQFGMVTSKVATLTLIPAPRLLAAWALCDASTVHVLYSKAVNLNGTYSFAAADGLTVNGAPVYGTNHNEVLLSVSPALSAGVTYTLTAQGVTSESGGQALVPDPTVTPVAFGAGSFFANFDDNTFPAGTVYSGPHGLAAADGVLHLTDSGDTGQNTGYYIPSVTGTAPIDHLHAVWRNRLANGQGCCDGYDNRPGADGMSFNWSPGLAAGTGSGELGDGIGLTVSIDTWDNNGAAGGDLGLKIKWKGAIIAYSNINPTDHDAAKDFLIKPGVTAPADGWVTAEVKVTSTGVASFTYNGLTITGIIPNFEPLIGSGYSFDARVGGANEDAWIDNVQINPASLTSVIDPAHPADVLITWPTCPGGTLEYSTDLGDAAFWQPVLVGGVNATSPYRAVGAAAPTGGTVFYRLTVP